MAQVQLDRRTGAVRHSTRCGRADDRLPHLADFRPMPGSGGTHAKVLQPETPSSTKHNPDQGRMMTLQTASLAQDFLT
jgi:hypothetical protein